jgi:hypothetical protein
MSFALSALVLASSLFAGSTLAQNGTHGGTPANLTEVIANATQFSFPEQNLTTITIEYQPAWSINASGHHFQNVSLPVVRERLTYFKVGELAVIDGDIIFGTEADLLRYVVPAGNGPSRRQAPPLARRSVSFSRDDVRKWPGGVVQYYWESQATKDARKDLFLQAVKIWTDRLPFLEFVDVGIKAVTTLGGPIILALSDKSVSSSPLGRAEWVDGNKMVLGATSNVGIYVHEIGHSKS